MLVAHTLKLSRGLLEKSSELWLWHTHEKSAEEFMREFWMILVAYGKNQQRTS